MTAPERKSEVEDERLEHVSQSLLLYRSPESEAEGEPDADDRKCSRSTGDLGSRLRCGIGRAQSSRARTERAAYR